MTLYTMNLPAGVAVTRWSTKRVYTHGWAIICKGTVVKHGFATSQARALRAIANDRVWRDHQTTEYCVTELQKDAKIFISVGC